MEPKVEPKVVCEPKVGIEPPYQGGGPGRPRAGDRVATRSDLVREPLRPNSTTSRGPAANTSGVANGADLWQPTGTNAQPSGTSSTPNPRVADLSRPADEEPPERPQSHLCRVYRSSRCNQQIPPVDPGTVLAFDNAVEKLRVTLADQRALDTKAATMIALLGGAVAAYVIVATTVLERVVGGLLLFAAVVTALLAYRITAFGDAPRPDAFAEYRG